ncbi:MAG: hypothetical protein Q9191_001363 [Dirinaria sp. TL-2023a]
MAAPASATMKAFAGDWVVNKGLSDDLDPMLKLQGIAWLVRKAITTQTVTLHVKQYEKDSVDTLETGMTGAAGLKLATEIRPLDWEFRERANPAFGTINEKTRYIQEAEIEDAFLREGWCPGEDLMECWGENQQRGWTGNQVWGFAMVKGERKHVRKFVVAKGEKVVKVSLVYDFVRKL